MNTLLITILFLINLLTVSNDSNADFESLIEEKFNTISYEQVVQDSHFKLMKILKKISKNQSRMILSIDQLMHLIDHEVISYKQSELLWIYLASKPEKPEEEEPQKINEISIKERDLEKNIKSIQIKSPSNKTSTQSEEKKTFSFYQLMFLILITYTIGIFFIIVIIVALYQRETFVFLCFLSIFLSYNFGNYAKILKDDTNAEFVPALLLNSSFCLNNLIIHLIMIKLKMQKKFLKWTDIFGTDEGFRGKLMQCFLNIFFSYNMAFTCKSSFIQVPFFFSIYHMVYLLSSSLEYYTHKKICPLWLFAQSFVAFTSLIYIYNLRNKSFVFLNKNEMPENQPDFQFMGYFFGVVVLNTLFPVFLYIQHKQFSKIYGTPEFSYKLIFKTFREEISQEVLIFDLNMLYYHVYAVSIVAMIYFGLRIKMVLMVVIPSFALQSYMGFIIKDERFIWMVFFYMGSLYVLHSVYLLGRMEDKLVTSIVGEFKDGLLLAISEICCKLMLIYYSMEAITTVYATKEDEDRQESDDNNDSIEEKELNEDTSDEDFEMFVNLILLVIKFFLHYVFGVYLYTIANEENSCIISIAYMIFATISFSKLLIYSSITKDEVSRILITCLIFFAALRLSVFPGKFNSPLYFGALLSNLSVFALYISFKNLLTLLISFLLLLSLFIHSFLMSTYIGLFFNLVNLSVFCAFFTAKNGRAILYNFLIIMGVILSLCFFTSFEIYFTIVDFFMKKIMPQYAAKFIASLKIFNNLKEMQIAQNALTLIENHLFGG